MFWSNRSEEGLIRPVMEELKKVGFEVIEYKIPDVPENVWPYLTTREEVPDYAICPFDRPPVAMAAFICYHAGIPVIQLEAGDISSGTFDDVDRHLITLMADYHFCAGTTQARRVRRLLRTVGKEPEHVYVSGPTGIDDISKAMEPPDGDYDVVIYNPPTKNLDAMRDELTQIINLLDKETYWIEPNGDEGSDYIKARVQETIHAGVKNITWTETMPHESFLGLLSRAKRIIGNSSCLYLEAPYFKAEIVPIGIRNRVREPILAKPGASRRIARKLKKWLSERP